MKKELGLIIVIVTVLIGINSLYGVTVSATVNRGGGENRCPLPSPIFVKVQNNTFSTIQDLTFDLELRKGENSDNVLKGSLTRVFGHIVHPFSSETGCFTDNYIKSLIEPHSLDAATATSREIISASFNTFKRYQLFENTHKVYISNVKSSSIP
ncbi:hypothetical protein AB4389_21800 [Vibrio cyclitrophicus]